jgi:hypothetical protein
MARVDGPGDPALAVLVRTLRQLDAARRVLDLLAAASLRALPLKGAALAELVYASPADRPMDDVDVLALDAPARALDVLRGAGFVPLAEADHAWSLRDPESGTAVELHRAIASPRGFHPIAVEAIWSRRVSGAGIVPLRPGDEDLLVQLAVHAAFQHGLGLKAVQWTDVARLVARPLDPARLDGIVREMRAADALAATLAGARAVLGPGAVPSALADRWGSVSLRRWAARVAAVRPDVPPRALALARWRLARGRRGELLRLTLAPGPFEGGAALRRAVHLGRRMFARAG